MITGLYLSPAKSYLDRSCTCFSYSVFSTLVDDPFPHPLHTPPSSHHSPSPLHHFTTSPLHHFTTPTHISPLLTPFPIISSHHSPSPLLRPLQLTTPQTTLPAPSSYHSKFLTTPPHCSPQCSRDPQQCCGADDLIFNLQPSPFQSVQHQYTKAPNESLMALQLAKLAKFMQEQM